MKNGKKAMHNCGFDLEREALQACGLQKEIQIAAYSTKLDQILYAFQNSEKGNSKEPLDLSKKLFRWLWEQKPKRYARGGPFGLREVIDQQLGKGPGPVGNCLGLTLLFNCLLTRMGIYVLALYVENAFDSGPHVLSLLMDEFHSVDIEHLSAEGFGFRGHLEDASRELWGDKELLADVFHSMGNILFLKGQYAEAIRCYDRALEHNPTHQRAELNRMILLNTK